MQRNQEEFDSLVSSVGVAMMTTRTRTGDLRSRAMANQKKADGADLWFVAADGSAKLDDLAHDPHVNLSYYKDRTREWISVAGVATITRDKAIIELLYESDWRMWFNDNGDPRAGTVDDPRLVLIGVKIHVASFYAVNQPAPVVLYELAKGWITGTQPDLGEVKNL